MATMDKTPIYHDMDLDELDRQYNARATVDDIAPVLEQYAKMSAAAKHDLDVMVDIPFGSRPEEVLDIFPAGEGAPVFLFIHGGYWRLLSKDDSAFFAPCFVEHGIAAVAVNYTLAPEASLDEITRQVRAAVAHIWHEAGRYGIDRRRIHIGGSSAGGHLVGMLLSDAWQADFGVPDDVISSAMVASGLFDLEPVRLCHPNEWIRLDEASARRNSPIHHLPRRGCPLLAGWAGSDTDEFKRQSLDYARAWQQSGFPVTTTEIADRNHFDIILDLADPARELTRQVFAMIGSTAK